MTSRRSFLKKFSTGAMAVSTLPGVANVILQPRKPSLGVALVGLGYYSTDLLAPALQKTQHCHLAGIVTGSPEKIPRWQRKYDIPDGNVYNYQTMATIANNPDIDVVYIVLPTGLHAQYAIIAANAGKHVWCEKPMARTVEECQGIVDACSRNKVKLSIGYRMQHEPNTRKIMTFARQQPYGKILSLTARAGYYDGRTNHWKQDKELGGGAMYDMGVYPVNGLRYASGMEPVAITARHETQRPEVYHEVDETTIFELEFPGGVIGKGATSLGRGMNELEVKCENGQYGLKPFQAYGGIKGKTSDGIVLDAYIPNQQARQMDDDALAIMNDNPVIVPGEEGLRDIRIVQAAYKAARTGEQVRF